MKPSTLGPAWAASRARLVSRGITNSIRGEPVGDLPARPVRAAEDADVDDLSFGVINEGAGFTDEVPKVVEVAGTWTRPTASHEFGVGLSSRTEFLRADFLEAVRASVDPDRLFVSVADRTAGRLE